MNSPAMHLDSAQATQPAKDEPKCPVCRASFLARRKWQRFCSPKCRNEYHSSMTPEVLRRDIDELKRQVVELRAIDRGDVAQ